jgi:hypothetical protein
LPIFQTLESWMPCSLCLPIQVLIVFLEGDTRRIWISNIIYHSLFFMFSELKWEVIVHFVDIVGVVTHHYLNFLFTIFHNNKVKYRVEVNLLCLIQHCIYNTHVINFRWWKWSYKILSKNLHTELQCLKMINDDKMFGVWQMIQSTLCSFKCKELFFYK